MARLCLVKARDYFWIIPYFKRWFLGETTVIAGVYGPVEAKMQKVLIDKASVECHYRPKSGLPGKVKIFQNSTIDYINLNLHYSNFCSIDTC